LSNQVTPIKNKGWFTYYLKKHPTIPYRKPCTKRFFICREALKFPLYNTMMGLNIFNAVNETLKNLILVSQIVQ